jgi:hypothetical protein
MRSLIRNPIPRSVAIALILVTQAQLLWVAAVHQHELLLAAQSSTLRHARPLPRSSPVTLETFCPVCQVIRHNAARTSAGISALHLGISGELQPAAPSVRPLICDLPILGGRAPPLY